MIVQKVSVIEAKHNAIGRELMVTEYPDFTPGPRTSGSGRHSRTPEAARSHKGREPDRRQSFPCHAEVEGL